MLSNSNKIEEGILFTDFYQLTMAQLYYKFGIHNTEAQFDYFFRSYPDYGNDRKAGYCVNAGIEWLLKWMKKNSFGEKEISRLRAEKSRSGQPLFKEDFLSWLQEEGNFNSINIRGIPEGRIVHPHLPVYVIHGPLAMSQILETSFLNHINYQTLVATKACRIKEAGRQQPFMDFGMRRAQGKGANAGARAALIGGADFTSNTGISYKLGVPPRGTHAHSMVQAIIASRGSELDAFRAYAEVYPDDCILLVDTIDTLESGVPNAIKVFKELKRKGHKPLGIRLDSGDLAHLAVRSAAMLDKAGFGETKIVLSNKLDEAVICQIISQIQKECRQYGVVPDKLIKRLVYGVGTRLITSKGDAALDGVYKLSAVKKRGKWVSVIKLSESPAKVVYPGNKYVWRIYDRYKKATADLIALKGENPKGQPELVLRHPVEAHKSRKILNSDTSRIEMLHRDIMRQGKIAYKLPDIAEIRKKREGDLKHLYEGVKRIVNPHNYHVSLSQKLWDLKQKNIEELKSQLSK